MPTLHTTTLPPQYIGETAIELPIANHTFKIDLRFTVFGELLVYECDVLELPEAALKMMYSNIYYQSMKAELEVLPYRLMLSAYLPDSETAKLPQYWQPAMQQLKTLRQGKALHELNVTPSHPYALHISEWLRKRYVENWFTSYYSLSKMPANTPVAIQLPIWQYYLKDTWNYELRLTAVESLGKLGDYRTIEPLIEALKDKYAYIRNAAVIALGKLGDARAVEPLISTLKDARKHVCHTAAIALGKLGDARAVEPLICALKGGNSAAAIALGNIGNAAALAPLQEALAKETTNIRCIRTMQKAIEQIQTKNRL